MHARVVFPAHAPSGKVIEDDLTTTPAAGESAVSGLKPTVLCAQHYMITLQQCSHAGPV